jgi:hypothetical protein
MLVCAGPTMLTPMGVNVIDPRALPEQTTTNNGTAHTCDAKTQGEIHKIAPVYELIQQTTLVI